MTSANVVFSVICWCCALIFVALAIWAFKRKDPMHFWSGSTVSPDEIADIPAYNRANGLMWSVYAVCLVVTGIASLFSVAIGSALLVVICVPGTIVLIMTYKRIYNKYKSTSAAYKSGKSVSKTPKTVTVISAVSSAVIAIVVGIIIWYGSREADVNVLDSGIEIKAMYGLNIDFSEISEVSLLNEPMSSMDVGMRTNGYGGFGQTLKGYFSSNALGETLLFVQSRSSLQLKLSAPVI